MVDVKNLYQTAMKVKLIAFAVSIAVIAVCVLCRKASLFEWLRDSFRYGGLLLAVFVIFILIWAVADFNGFWIQFHYLLFDNELFFLDPNTEILINMVPETFFFDLVTRIILVFFAVLTVFGGGLMIYGKKAADAA